MITAGEHLHVAYETLYASGDSGDCDWEGACSDGFWPAAAQLRVAGAALPFECGFSGHLSDAAASLKRAAEVTGCIVMAAAASDDVDACGRSLTDAGQAVSTRESRAGESLVEAGAALVAFAASLNLGRAVAAAGALLLLYFPFWCLPSASATTAVNVYHYIDDNMGKPFSGEAMGCLTPPGHRCVWWSSSRIATLAAWHKKDELAISVSVYNIHLNYTDPDLCVLPTTLTLAESEESRRHRTPQTNKALVANFDGFSTTHNLSSVQRAYREVWTLNASSLLPPRPFISMIKGASFIASNCRPRSRRNELVMGLRARGVRVDGLAACLATRNLSEGVELGVAESEDQRDDYAKKKAALSKYLFSVVAENDVEPWHITEKVYHAWHAGTVPVYLGADDLRALLPHPKAAIFVVDFGDVAALASYLMNLTRDEAAYEEHRAWRATFSRSAYLAQPTLPDIAARSWYCRVCDWARTTSPTQHHRAQVKACNAPFYIALVRDVGGVFVAHWRSFLCGAALWAYCTVATILWLRRRKMRGRERHHQ